MVVSYKVFVHTKRNLYSQSNHLPLILCIPVLLQVKQSKTSPSHCYTSGRTLHFLLPKTCTGNLFANCFHLSGEGKRFLELGKIIRGEMCTRVCVHVKSECQKCFLSSCTTNIHTNIICALNPSCRHVWLQHATHWIFSSLLKLWSFGFSLTWRNKTKRLRVCISQRQQREFWVVGCEIAKSYHLQQIFSKASGCAKASGPRLQGI